MIMKNIIYKKHVLRKATIVLISLCLLTIIGYTQAAPSGSSAQDPPLKPAYINSLDDLVKVPLHHRLPLAHPKSPLAADVNIIELLQQLNETLILRYLENLTAFGPRVTGTEGCDQAALYLYQTFQAMGVTVRYHNYTDNIVSGSNIEATLEGSDSTNIFIICGHYDTVAAGVGADDDGSGVAAVLAAAEILHNYNFLHTIRFVCFSGEEQGLVGSRHYAEDAYNSNVPIVAVLNADMIGFAPSASDGTQGKIYENTASEWIVDFTNDINQIYTDYIGIQPLIPQGESGGSDHYYFWQYGYDAVFYFEFNFNDYYHSADDTIEHMNISYSTRYSRLILATLAEMALQPRPVLEISNITGGIGLRARISNVGDENATDVNVTLTVRGGLFRLIDKTFTYGTPLLAPQGSIQFKGIMLLGIGSIEVSVTAVASNADQVTRRATGYLLGPFVLKVVNTP
jgi:hypothetical protein